ncbi:GNAT family N-acetyltransferase [Desulfoluna spongiiphila]|uniref:Ribosomal protein S18 acetylase RimI n=1 Tax=Desulfoluna spongiiphila TaxID=419481 RepID=A0A1G5E9I8_9BACT|nr:GNAT family N-acetyltransferase [Desulfoluna spongiiphila]SCY23577.1 Ribosomal protein S18 acetylase RimI [Desulfoluna spongiiphila]VVS91666.1 acyl-coa n-acyltransferase [Desulfoluna spongiiphila]
MTTHRPIAETDWPRILDIQRECYAQHFRESLEALKSRWAFSPDTCLVAEGPSGIIGYALSHPWRQGHAPALGIPLDEGISPDLLYIHDVAVSKGARGSGAASLLVRALTACAVANGLNRMALTSVQKSAPFWTRHGFTPAAVDDALESYGDDAVYMVSPLPV